MAEEQDDAQKTEEPTQRRLQEARDKGQVASSREVNHAIMLGAATLLIALAAGGLTGGVRDALRPFVELPHALPTGPDGLRSVLIDMLLRVAAPLLLPIGLLFAAALATGLVQNGLVFSGQSLQPKLSKISPAAGAKRLFSLRSLVEFGKGVLKVILVGATGLIALWPHWLAITQSGQLAPAQWTALAQRLALWLMGGAVAVTTLIALLDFTYQRFEHRKKLRMSRRDLQDETKQSEGDPVIRARLRSLRMERARRRMMAEVPNATAVITNPTHLAVALRYEAATHAAPVVVAKGADLVAQRIREVAREHGVPLIENPPLARTLHAAVDLGKEIRPEHYRAVAEVIGFVLRQRR